ncbi:MAG: hypothetical protein HZY79_05060 [Rhodoblastus sp.]|nr:MAG: hypothetical protein HZY79_05060 [Rhodoblastus sp.]
MRRLCLAPARVVALLAAILGLITPATLITPACAQERRPAGYVVAVEAPPGAPAPVLRREGQPIEAQVWTPLFDGDALEVEGAAALVIETAKDKRLRVDAARSPHRVVGEMGGGGRFAALAARLGDLFRAKPEATATNLVGRADAPPRFTLGAARGQRVAAGAPLWAAWRDGAAPFTLELLAPARSARAPLAAIRTDAQSAALVVPAGAAGRLTLLLRDAEGRVAKAELTVAPAPSPPDWIAAGAPTPETAALARAVGLVAQARPA